MMRFPFGFFFLITLAAAPISTSLAAASSEDSVLEASSYPEDLTAIGDGLYFSADDGMHGREPWVRDVRTPGGAHLLADIEPGPGPSNPKDFHDLGGRVLFLATTSAHGSEPWVYDPSVDKVRLLKDILPGPASSEPVLAGTGKGVFYMLSRNAVDDMDLWTVEPDSLDVSYVARIGDTGEFSGAVLNDGRLVFASVNSLWVTSGTAKGTAGIYEPDRPSDIRWITAIGERVVFTVSDLEHGAELFVSDGAQGGTRLVKDIRPGPMGSGIGQICAWGPRALFQADDGETGLELWITDGTAAGTAMVKDIAPGKEGSDPHYFLNVADFVYFAADDGVSGIELWGTDGTQAGTGKISDLAPSRQAASIWSLAKYGDVVYFCANSREYGEEIFFTDRSPGHVTILRNIVPGPGGSDPNNLVRCSKGLYFTCNDGKHGEELWFTLGRGTRLDTDIRVTSQDRALSASPQELTDLQGRLLFSACDIEHGRELWVSDGTSDGTALAADISPGPSDSRPQHLVVQGPRLFFTAEDPATGRELWTSDGTAPNTRLVRDIRSGPVGSNPRQLTATADRLYFLADNDLGETWLWSSDGTSEETTVVPGENPDTAAIAVVELFVYKDCLYVYAAEPRDQVSLYCVDRETPKLRRVACPVSERSRADLLRPHKSGEVLPADLSLSPGDTLMALVLFPFGRKDPSSIPPMIGDTAFFVAYTPENGTELWKSKGTTFNAGLVSDVCPGRVSSCPTHLVPVGNTLYFIAEHPEKGRVLWQTDGASEGTNVVRPFHTDGTTWPPISAVDMTRLSNDRIILTAPHPTLGEPGRLELAVMTIDGQNPVLDVLATGTDRFATPPRQLTSCGSLVYFSCDDGVHGDELWVTDGTTQGTRMVKDILTSPSQPSAQSPVASAH